MKTKQPSHPSGITVTLTDYQLSQALGSVATHIEEHSFLASRDDLRQLVGLHSRLCRAFGLEPDYVFRNGCVFGVNNPDEPIVIGPRTTARIDRSPGAAHA
jgi:hypothetical protein